MKALIAFGLLALVPWLGHDTATARAVAFHFMAIGQLFFIYPARHTWVRPLPNPYVHAAVAAGIADPGGGGGVAVVRAAARQLVPAAAALGRGGRGGRVSWAAAEGIAAIVWRRNGAMTTPVAL